MFAGSVKIARMTWIVVIVLLGALLWGIVSFNLLVRDRHRVAQAWSDVGVQLKRRHDLIPKLVETVRQYASYEGALLEHVTELRARGINESTPAGLGPIEGSLADGINRVFAVAEQYPELKASENFLDLQRNLTEVETQIQYARRYYNGAVNNLNTRIDTFPDLLVARVFGFTAAEYFEPEPAAAARLPES